MVELEQYLQASAQDVQGIQMVPLSVALQAMQTASNVKMLESLDSIMSDLHNSILDADLTNTPE